MRNLAKKTVTKGLFALFASLFLLVIAANQTQAASLPNLVITSIVPDLGSNQVQITVKNIGTAKVSNQSIPYRIRVSQDGVNKTFNSRVQLAPNQEATSAVTLTSISENPLTVKVDSSNVVKESNEKDNTTTYTYVTPSPSPSIVPSPTPSPSPSPSPSIEPSPTPSPTPSPSPSASPSPTPTPVLPNLVVSNVTTTPNPVVKGQAYSVTVEITNDSPTPVTVPSGSAITMTIRQYTHTHYATLTNFTLNQGEKMTKTVTMLSQNFSTQLLINVDSYNQIAETNDADNIARYDVSPVDPFIVDAQVFISNTDKDGHPDSGMLDSFDPDHYMLQNVTIYLKNTGTTPLNVDLTMPFDTDAWRQLDEPPVLQNVYLRGDFTGINWNFNGLEDKFILPQGTLLAKTGNLPTDQQGVAYITLTLRIKRKSGVNLGVENKVFLKATNDNNGQVTTVNKESMQGIYIPMATRTIQTTMKDVNNKSFGQVTMMVAEPTEGEFLYYRAGTSSFYNLEPNKSYVLYLRYGQTEGWAGFIEFTTNQYGSTTVNPQLDFYDYPPLTGYKDPARKHVQADLMPDNSIQIIASGEITY